VHTRGSKEGVEQHSYVLLSGVVGMPPKRAAVSRHIHIPVLWIMGFWCMRAM